MNDTLIHKYLKKINVNFKSVLTLSINNSHFYRKLNIFLINQQKQTGGGDIKPVLYNIKLPDHNDQITIEESLDQENGDKLFRLFTKNNDKECLLMIKMFDEIHIESLNVYSDCVTSKNTRLNGSALITIALNFIEAIKNEEKITKITLIDKAEKFCYNKITKKSEFYDLSKFKTLISGDTWYGGYGFRPASNKPNEASREKILYKNINYRTKTRIDPVGLHNYNKNKEFIKNLLVKNSYLEEIVSNKIKNEKNEELIKILDHFLKFIIKNKDKKLTAIISNFLRYDKINERCFIINYIMDDIFTKNNLISFSQRLFVKII